MARVGVRLTEILLSRPQQTAIDMSDVCMCETIDALGLAGFDKAFNSIEAISEGQRADLLHVRLLEDCHAVVLLLVNSYLLGQTEWTTE